MRERWNKRAKGNKVWVEEKEREFDEGKEKKECHKGVKGNKSEREGGRLRDCV